MSGQGAGRSCGHRPHDHNACDRIRERDHVGTRTERHRVSRRRPGEGGPHLTCHSVDDAHDMLGITGRGRQPKTVCAERDAVGLRRTAGQRRRLSTRLDVPDTDRRLDASNRQSAAVGAECHRRRPGRPDREHLHRCPITDRPEPDRAVVCCAGQHRPVSAEGQGGQPQPGVGRVRSLVAHQVADDAPIGGREQPNRDRVPLARGRAFGGKQRAVRAPGHSRAAGQRRRQLPARRVPHAQSGAAGCCHPSPVRAHRQRPVAHPRLGIADNVSRHRR